MGIVEERLEQYAKWKEAQQARAKEFYADPFTGDIPEYNKISYLHTFNIGGTVDSQILGVNHYQSKHDAYDNMINFKEHENKFVFARGKFLEPFVAKQFELLTRKKVKEGITLNGDDYGCPWSFSQIDFLCEDEKKTIPLEIKVSTVNYNDEDGDKVWGKGSEFNANGVLLLEDEQVPMEYYIQCQKQMWLYGSHYMYLAVWLTFETKIRVFVIHRNEKVISEIIDAERDFLFNHVIPQIPYEEVDKTLDEPVENVANAVYADEEFRDLYDRYVEVNKTYTQAKKENDSLSKQLKEMMGDYEVVIGADGTKLCSVTHIQSRRFDLDKFKNDNPELYTEYLSLNDSTRFNIAKRK